MSRETAVRKASTNRQTPIQGQGPRVRRFVRRFLRAERGVTAIEFGLISVPLMLMTFGLLELALVFLVGATLDSATDSASRQIRTGEFQTSAANTGADFKNKVCGNMGWLSGQCAAGLWVSVQTFSNFSGLAAAPPPNPAAFAPASRAATVAALCFKAGQPTDIVLVRTYFQWRLFTPLLDNALENMGGGSGTRLITSTTAFRNEPYNANPPLGTSC
jgi:Flp pilus assembly protein TadG